MARACEWGAALALLFVGCTNVPGLAGEEWVSQKKLLFIVNVDWFFISHRLPIALKAIEKAYEVHVLCAITDQAEYLERLGLIVHPLSFSRSGRNVFSEIVIIFKLYQQIKHINPDLVHLVTIKPVLYGGIVARLARVPSVVSAISGLGFLFGEKKRNETSLVFESDSFFIPVGNGTFKSKSHFSEPI